MVVHGVHDVRLTQSPDVSSLGVNGGNRDTAAVTRHGRGAAGETTATRRQPDETELGSEKRNVIKKQAKLDLPLSPQQ